MFSFPSTDELIVNTPTPLAQKYWVIFVINILKKDATMFQSKLWVKSRTKKNLIYLVSLPTFLLVIVTCSAPKFFNDVLLLQFFLPDLRSPTAPVTRSTSWSSRSCSSTARTRASTESSSTAETKISTQCRVSPSRTWGTRYESENIVCFFRFLVKQL